MTPKTHSSEFFYTHRTLSIVRSLSAHRQVKHKRTILMSETKLPSYLQLKLITSVIHWPIQNVKALEQPVHIFFLLIEGAAESHCKEASCEANNKVIELYVVDEEVGGWTSSKNCDIKLTDKLIYLPASTSTPYTLFTHIVLTTLHIK